MKRRYTLSPEAEIDLDTIKAYLVEHAGVRIAQYVVREIKEAMRFLAGMPEAGHTREDLTSEAVKFWPVYSYLIIYDPRPRPVEIVRVLDGRRDVATILEL